jgi:hypothetical protein
VSGNYSVSLWVTDEAGSTSAAAVTGNVVVGNCAPDVSGITITPNPASCGDDVRVTVNTTDADTQANEQQYRYEVLRFGSGGSVVVAATVPDSASGYVRSAVQVLSTGAGNTLSRGGLYAVRVTVFDGSSTSTSTSANFTVGDCEPQVELAQTSLSADCGNNVTLTVASYSDPEGNPAASYMWTISGGLLNTPVSVWARAVGRWSVA